MPPKAAAKPAAAAAGKPAAAKPASAKAGSKPGSASAGGAAATAAGAAGAASAAAADVPAAPVVIDARREKIRAAFAIFDSEGTDSVPVDDVPTILRYLDIYVPSRDFEDKIKYDMHEDEPKPTVTRDRFEKVAIQLLDSRQYAPDEPDMLLAAWRVLDAEGKGYLDVGTVKGMFKDVGDPGFSEAEMDAFMKELVDKADPTRVYYEDYVAMMSSR